jgi:hypothetical protein
LPLPRRRVAGQRHHYIEKQLTNFKDHTRDNLFSRQYIWGATAALPPESVRGLVNYFSTLPPKAANDGDSELAAAGKKVYELGSPDSNIVSCLVCYGPNAEGVRHSSLGRSVVFLLKKKVRAVGRRISHSCRAYAANLQNHCQQTKLTPLPHTSASSSEHHADIHVD